MGHRTVTALAVAALTLTGGAAIAQAARQAPGEGSIKGTWRVVVDPQPGPAGDRPAFESILAFGQAHEVVEVTSNPANPPGVTGPFDMTAGLGTWTETGDNSYRIVFEKYRFDPAGAYIGKTVVTDDVVMTSADSFAGQSVARVYGLVGTTPTATISLTSMGTRFTG